MPSDMDLFAMFDCVPQTEIWRKIL
jgi:hypothetical protein